VLPRVQAPQDVSAEAALLHDGRELLHDLEVDVGFKQREPDLAHRLVDIGLGELPARADVGKGGL
jgi:hypothetical protein